MARYQAQVESAAAVAVDTGFAWVMATASVGFRLRRVTLGVKLATAAAVTDFQAVVGFNRVSSAGTTPVAGMVPVKLDPSSGAAACAWDIVGWAVVPTFGTADYFEVAFNSKTTVDIPFENPESMQFLAATTVGLMFVNRKYALPASHSYVITVEWEE